MNKYLLILFYVLMALIGEYVPQRDNNGELLPKQCWGSTGYCWCEFTEEKKRFRNAIEIECPKKSI